MRDYKDIEVFKAPEGYYHVFDHVGAESTTIVYLWNNIGGQLYLDDDKSIRVSAKETYEGLILRGPIRSVAW